MRASRSVRLAPQRSVLIRVAGLAVTCGLLLAMTACGGDDDDATGEAFTVSVELPGFDQATVRSGEEVAALTVPFWKLDLSKVQFSSSTDTTWSVLPASAAVDVIEDAPTRRVVSLARMNTGEVVTFVFRSAAQGVAGEARVRITAEVEAQRYYPNYRRVGETFEWQSTNVSDGNETKSTEAWRVTEVGAGGSYKLESDPPGSGFSEWYLRGGTRVEWEFDSLSGLYFNPSDKAYDFPLYVGKEWLPERLAHVFDEVLETLRWYGLSTVQRRETVTVPAGTYDSLRIYTREALYSDIDGAEVRTIERTCWWSIELSAEVRCVGVHRYSIEGKAHESSGTSELVKYTAPP
jgi:hypothetical protein